MCIIFFILGWFFMALHHLDYSKNDEVKGAYYHLHFDQVFQYETIARDVPYNLSYLDIRVAFDNVNYCSFHFKKSGLFVKPSINIVLNRVVVQPISF
jgi:hypothetical protein